MPLFRLLRALCASLCLWGAACNEWSPAVDLEGPRVVASSLAGPRTIEHGVAQAIELRFSEPVDPATLSAGSLAIVPWTEVGRCDLTPSCEEGSCERGRCQIDPLSDAELSRIDRGEFAAETALEWSLAQSPAGPSTLLRVIPKAALAEHWRYSLVLGGGLRDRSGAPLVNGEGERSRWRQDFVTASAGSSGPEAQLVSPAVGEVVPVNLARVVTRFPQPVDASDDATLDLLAEDGSAITLTDPQECAGWVPGYCLEWLLGEPLTPGIAYRLAGGSLTDRRERTAYPAHELAWFVADLGEDLDPPDVSAVHAWRQGRCLHASFVGSEALTLVLESGGQIVTASTAGPGGAIVEVALALDPWPEPSSEVRATLMLTDRAGNRAEQERVLGAVGAPLPAIALVEVLANPAGPEPAQEMVELLDLRAYGEAVEISSLWLAARSWAEISTALAEGEAPGRPIPDFFSEPGQRTVLVGDSYTYGDPLDPDPPASAEVVVLAGSLGVGGLGNGGEPVTIYDPIAAVQTTSYGSPRAVQSKSDQGRSVVNEHAQGCDVAASWVTHPLGSSSPGWSP